MNLFFLGCNKKNAYTVRLNKICRRTTGSSRPYLWHRDGAGAKRNAPFPWPILYTNTGYHGWNSKGNSFNARGVCDHLNKVEDQPETQHRDTDEHADTDVFGASARPKSNPAPWFITSPNFYESSDIYDDKMFGFWDVYPPTLPGSTNRR